MNTALPTLADLHDPALHSVLQAAMDNKTKPPGSLGQLEALAVQIGEILGTDKPVLAHPQMVVFAADHGLTAQGISAFPADVSWQMVENFLAGGAAVSVLARQHGLALTVVDCGVNRDFLVGLPTGAQRPGLVVRKVAGAEHGTADSSQGAAMSQAQCEQAMRHGMELVRGLPGNALLLGEMGIGNTSAASLLLARLAGLDIALCTGAGTGLDAALRCLDVDAAIDLEIDRLAECVDRLAQGGDLGELALDEGLSAEPGIDAHHQNEVEIAQHMLDGGKRRRRIEHRARLPSEALDELDRAMDVRTGLGVKGDHVGAGIDIGRHQRIDRRDHQVDVEGLPAVLAPFVFAGSQFEPVVVLEQYLLTRQRPLEVLVQEQVHRQ
jgi:nicotinate-nucleotide--dimethylbenzimidazole phosphoribosyltransferase